MSSPGPGSRRVAVDEEGQRLDAWLAGWLNEPRARSQRRVRDGAVRVNGKPARKGQRLCRGETVVVAADTAPLAMALPEVAIRYQDDSLAVVVKPAGLLTHATGGVPKPTLVSALQAQGMALAPGQDPARPGIVHRLDRGTSGLLVVAKTQAAAEALRTALRRHDIERTYAALVEGVPIERSATIDAPLGRRRADPTRVAVVAGGRRARTHYDVVETFSGRDCPAACLLVVRLETGRTHQVRVHVAAIGHPVIADVAYGACAEVRGRLGLRRPALHARRLRFLHPISAAPVEVEEALPADMAAAIARLRCEAASP